WPNGLIGCAESRLPDRILPKTDSRRADRRVIEPESKRSTIVTCRASSCTRPDSPPASLSGERNGSGDRARHQPANALSRHRFAASARRARRWGAGHRVRAPAWLHAATAHVFAGRAGGTRAWIALGRRAYRFRAQAGGAKRAGEN